MIDARYGLPFLLSLAGVLMAHTSDAAPPQPTEHPIPVWVQKTTRGFELTRDGKPYFIRGAGGSENLSPLVQAGGNSIRTWGAENLTPLLDRAQSLGLTVTIGIWLGHKEHGFKYDDPKMVAEQFEQARGFVRQYRNHPALLLWGIGNEMEGDGKDPNVWKAVNDIAKMIHQEDPNHPAMTVVAEIGGEKLPQLKTLCPDVDILGVNSYGGMPSLPERLQKGGWERPYVITEFGPFGPWEVGKTAWNAPLEATSTEKAKTYLASYQHTVAAQKGRCLGSYVFLWGNKQEATSTWFGMFLKSGEALEPVDVMTYLWSGKWPANRAPQLEGLQIEADVKALTPGEHVTARVRASDPDGDPLTVHWEVRSESNDRKTGGDAEREPDAHPDAVVAAKGMELAFRVPKASGAYRLFVTLYDGKGHAATANLPFYVKATSL